MWRYWELLTDKSMAEIAAHEGGRADAGEDAAGAADRRGFSFGGGGGSGAGGFRSRSARRASSRPTSRPFKLLERDREQLAERSCWRPAWRIRGPTPSERSRPAPSRSTASRHTGLTVAIPPGRCRLPRRQKVEKGPGLSHGKTTFCLEAGRPRTAARRAHVTDGRVERDARFVLRRRQVSRSRPRVRPRRRTGRARRRHHRHRRRIH